jgi:hypothetical protein
VSALLRTLAAASPLDGLVFVHVATRAIAATYDRSSPLAARLLAMGELVALRDAGLVELRIDAGNTLTAEDRPWCPTDDAGAPFVTLRLIGYGADISFAQKIADVIRILTSASSDLTDVYFSISPGMMRALAAMPGFDDHSLAAELVEARGQLTAWRSRAECAEQALTEERATATARITGLERQLADQDIEECHLALTAAGVSAGSLIERVEDLIGERDELEAERQNGSLVSP